MRFHPQWHGIFLEGGFDHDGRFIHIPFGNLEKMAQAFRQRVLALLLDLGLSATVPRAFSVGAAQVSVSTARSDCMPRILLPWSALRSTWPARRAFGLTLLKFFPAEAFGGLKVIKALSAPYAHAGVKFMPTGGMSLANLPDYLAEKAVACVGGTWRVRK